MSVLSYIQCNDCGHFVWDEGAEDVCERLLLLTCDASRSNYIDLATGKTSLEMMVDAGELPSDLVVNDDAI